MSKLTPRELARLATSIENGAALPGDFPVGEGLVVGITGPPGAGKSSLADALTAELRHRGKMVAILAVDPSSRATGGAILGDRVRMQRHHSDPGVFIRSMATRGNAGGLAKASMALAKLFRGAGYDYVILETVGVGQDEIEVASHADVTVVVLVPGMGDEVQAIKAGIMEIADIFVINKADRPGAEQMRAELESMLPHPVVYCTVAIDGTGVAELTDALVERRMRAARPAKNANPMREFAVDHIGIAVRSISEALPFYEQHLGMEPAIHEDVEQERVHVAMLRAGQSRIELLEASDAESAIAKFIEKRGPGLHHVALRVPDLAATAARLTAAGVRLLGPPQTGAGGHQYVFVHPASTGGVLWELIQSGNS